MAGILEGLQVITDSTAEFKDLHSRIMRIFYDILVKNTKRLELLELDKQFCEALDMVRMLKSAKKEDQDLSINFALLLLHHDKDVKMSDLVGYDFESRDVITKRQGIKMWEAINDIGKKFTDVEDELEGIIIDKIDDEIEVMQGKFNKTLKNAISANKIKGSDGSEISLPTGNDAET